MNIKFLLGKFLGVRLLGNMVNCIFNLICQTVFQHGCTILHSHQQCKRVPVATYWHHHLVLSLILILTISQIGSDIPLSFCLLYLTDKDIKQLVTCLCAIYICLLVKCKIKFLHNFYRVLCQVSRVIFTFTYAISHNTLLLFLFDLPFNHFQGTTFPCNKIIAINMIKLHRTLYTYQFPSFDTVL